MAGPETPELARAAESGGADLIEIGVRHHNSVVLGPAHRLHALSGGNAARIDILRDIAGTDKADR